MRCETIRPRLDDYVDGYLTGGGAEEVARHLKECATCRREAEAIRRLVAMARNLPAGSEPPRDLWPEIAPRLGPAPSRAEVGTTWRRRGLLAAAVVALMFLSSLVTLWWTRETPGEQQTAVRSQTDPSVLAQLARTEDRSLLVRTDLLRVLEEKRGALAPETVAAVEKNLQIIDEAIAEIHRALEQDPTSPHLKLLLARTYRQEVNLLRQLSRISEDI